MSSKHLFIEEMAFSSRYCFASSASDPDELSTLGTAIDAVGSLASFFLQLSQIFPPMAIGAFSHIHG